jgi:hypothetical protein
MLERGLITAENTHADWFIRFWFYVAYNGYSIQQMHSFIGIGITTFSKCVKANKKKEKS